MPGSSRHPRQPDLYDPPTIIKPEPLHSEFNDAIGFTVEAGRLHVDRHADPAAGLRSRLMEMGDGNKAALHAVIRMHAQKVGRLRMAIGCGSIHFTANPAISPLLP